MDEAAAVAIESVSFASSSVGIVNFRPTTGGSGPSGCHRCHKLSPRVDPDRLGNLLLLLLPILLPLLAAIVFEACKPLLLLLMPLLLLLLVEGRRVLPLLPHACPRSIFDARALASSTATSR